MGQSNVTVVDYGIGNLKSVASALEACHAEVCITDQPELIRDADRLVLPGVGAFKDGMKLLEENGLTQVVKKFALSGKPFLGICLGMQMLLDVSEEFGEYSGLGIVPGRVRPIPTILENGDKNKVPHIGWNKIFPPKSNGQPWAGTILEDIQVNEWVYFVHSFVSQPSRATSCLAYCDYNGIKLAAVVKVGNAYGCQFHPEKSGSQGLKILSNFLRVERLSESQVNNTNLTAVG